MGGEAHAFSQMVGHMEFLREFFVPFPDVSSGAAGLAGRKSPPPHLLNKRMATEKYLVRHFSSIPDLVQTGANADVL